MEERAAALGGVLRITTAPDAGTTIDLELPLDPRPHR
jgi:signal transduction histidine kinase